MRDNKSIAIIVLSVLLIIEGLAGTYFIFQAFDYRNQRDRVRDEAASLRNDLAKERQERAAEAESTDNDLNKLEPLDQLDKGIESDNGDLVVTSPREEDVTSGTVTVSGRAIAFESTVNIRIKDANGAVVTETFVITDAAEAGEFGDFSKTINFAAPKTNEGTVEVFLVSAEDGTEIEKITIPVTFFE